MTTLITPTTTAVVADNTQSFHLGQSYAMVSADALAGTEEVDLEYSADDGATWVTAQNSAGPIVLTATLHQVLIHGPGMYRVAKDATIAACGVFVRMDQSP